ncbi:MAG TPA: DUF167 domain-containing protein [Spirochaetia bacterium]|nr:DUF167 domain-containing protein [Spirochaetia bacterium]
MAYLREEAGGVVLQLRVQPRSSANRVGGVQGEALKVHLTAPPVEGEANEALIRFLAEKLGVSRGAVRLVSGQNSRHKLVRVEGLTGPAARERLDPGRS